MNNYFKFTVLTFLIANHTSIQSMSKPTDSAQREFLFRQKQADELNKALDRAMAQNPDQLPIVDFPLLHNDLVEQVIESGPLKFKNLLRAHKGDRSKGAKRVLLKGSSGAGKSTLARAFAQDCGLPFVSLSAWSVVSRRYSKDYLEKVIDSIAQQNKPYFVIINTLENLINKNDEPDLVPALCGWLDRCNQSDITFIATIDSKTVIPLELSKRFSGGSVQIDLPNKIKRKEIINFYILNNLIRLEKGASVGLDELTEGFSPGDIENMFKLAASDSVNREFERIYTKKKLVQDEKVKAINQRRSLQRKAITDSKAKGTLVQQFQDNEIELLPDPIDRWAKLSAQDAQSFCPVITREDFIESLNKIKNFQKR